MQQESQPGQELSIPVDEPTGSRLSTRLLELGTLKDGWLNGEGLALPASGLQFISEQIVAPYPETIALPAAFPTAEGNMLWEWNLTGSPSIEFDLTELSALYHALTPTGGSVQHEFDLRSSEGRSLLFAFLLRELDRSAS